MTKKRIYLSGPISGYDLEERKIEFLRAQAVLEKNGFEVFNPMQNGLPRYASTFEHMRRDIEELLKCDAIFFMKRFTHSAGCLTEMHVATAIGMDVYFEECLSPHKGIRFS